MFILFSIVNKVIKLNSFFQKLYTDNLITTTITNKNG